MCGGCGSDGRECIKMSKCIELYGFGFCARLPSCDYVPEKSVSSQQLSQSWSSMMSNMMSYLVAGAVIVHAALAPNGAVSGYSSLKN